MNLEKDAREPGANQKPECRLGVIAVSDERSLTRQRDLGSLGTQQFIGGGEVRGIFTAVDP